MKFKINRELVPIKAHFFFFFAGKFIIITPNNMENSVINLDILSQQNYKVR